MQQSRGHEHLQTPHLGYCVSHAQKSSYVATLEKFRLNRCINILMIVKEELRNHKKSRDKT